ncbi:hypothetical protein ACA910_014840 [Epithemia clementina (nom. ined.)]
METEKMVNHDEDHSDSEGSVLAPEDEEGTDDARSSNEGPGGTRNSDSSASIQIAKSETKAVNRSKVVVYAILVVLAVASAVGTWYYVTLDETSDFEDQFAVYADDILESSYDKARTVFEQLDALSLTITSHSMDAKEPWLDVPYFYKWTEHFADLLDSSLIIFAPIVNISDTQEWLDYVRNDPHLILVDPEDPDQPKDERVDYIQGVPDHVVRSTNMTLLPDETMMLPILQYGPGVISNGLINMDLNTHPVIQAAFRDTLLDHNTMVSQVTDLSFLTGYTKSQADPKTPRSIIMGPVFDKFDKKSRSMAGVVMAVLEWDTYLKSSRPDEVHHLTVHVSDTCGSEMTFLINGQNVDFMGVEDTHDTRYDHMVRKAEFATFTPVEGLIDGKFHCNYSLAVYPMQDFESDFHSSKPYLYAAMLVAVFFTTSFVFAIYDWMVQRRQEKVMGAAQRTTAIVNSLFPREVGERLIAEEGEKMFKHKNAKNERVQAFAANLKSSKIESERSDPIADLFPCTTIMFADIVGFTAWSSTREPKQVFTLLETIYQEFDTIANRRHVFKVETVGDCYVAVAGLPQPRPDHAVVMARFARDCMYRFQAICPQMEVALGPDTAELAIRIGLHSGPVTAGVLRGERARFQLFGDTMNTASRMESTSRPNKIQISQETTDLLNDANKGHWCEKRLDLVEAKGKGLLQTYWLSLLGGKGSSSSDQSNRQNDKENLTNMAGTSSMKRSMTATNSNMHKNSQSILMSNDDESQRKEDRLIRWNVEILTKLLVKIKMQRLATSGTKAEESLGTIRALEGRISNSRGTVLDEVKEIIKLPPYNRSASNWNPGQMDEVTLPESVIDQLHKLVTEIASLYHQNPFHNFEHASHVAMSVVKLMSRIVAPTVEADGETADPNQILHDHTYGITSDPMTQFACALSAVIHDVDHGGVPNAQLVKEQNSLAIRYKNKSVAEQNSVGIAWELLMQDSYRDLRCAIYTTTTELKRFRQLLVNSVMATDIVDKELNAQRKNRWAVAFSEGVVMDSDVSDTINRKATIVLEHLIQASDVAHTMQHFQIYQKWNSRLFQEMYRAYQEGRSDKDPSEFWYQGEIGFFEFYIIPLAKQLKDCGVFGVSSDEYLNYATRNKREWMARGQQLVEEFKEEALRIYGKREEPITSLPSMRNMLDGRDQQILGEAIHGEANAKEEDEDEEKFSDEENVAAADGKKTRGFTIDV